MRLHVRICIHRHMHIYTKVITQQGAVAADGSAYEILLKSPWLEKSAKSSGALDAKAVGDAEP